MARFRSSCGSLVVGLLALSFSAEWSAGEVTAPVQASDKAAPRDAKPEALRGWQHKRFGMFIHWGPVSLKGTEIGWSRQGPRRGRARGGTGSVPMAEYDNLYKKFDPVKFNADQWTQIARDAGMKYIVFTSKHHDGFSCFDSKLTDYKITSPASPYGKDICKQLADACHRRGLGLGWYYSPRDWYHPDFATANHARYLEFYLGQLRELATNYGKVDVFWFDGLDSPRELWGDTPLKSFEMLRKLQPDILLNNRGGLPGDFDTPEQRVGGFNRERPWETCMTICRQWAWKPNDTLKSKKQCIQTLLHTVGGDGNLLFNVGPMPDGRIEPRQIERLKEMGNWLTKYGDGVYGTRGGPFKPGRWGAATCKDDKVYLFVMNWPQKGPLVLPAIGAKVAGGRRLDGGMVAVQQDAEGVRIDVPADQRAAIATVVELTVDGRAFAIEPIAVVHRSAAVSYGKNTLASNVFQKTTEYGPDMALDDDPKTRWATDAGTAAAWIEIDLGQPMSVGRFRIDEPAEYQRVQAFELQHHDGATWKTFHNGTTIGPNWSKRVTPVTAQRFRLNITGAADGPTLSEVQLFAPGK